MSEGPAIREQILLEIQTPTKGSGLAELVKELKQADAYIDKINAKVSAGVRIPANLTRTMAEVQAQLSKLPKGIIGPEEAARILGLNPAMLRQALEKVKTQLARDFKSSFRPGSLEFESLSSASKGIHTALQAQIKALEAARNRFWKDAAERGVLTPRVGEVKAQGGSVTAKVEGQIPLQIPAAQVNASVIGEIKLTIPGAQVAVTGAGRAENGRFISPNAGGVPSGMRPGGGSGGGGAASGKPAKKGTQTLYFQPSKPGEFGRLVTEAGESVRETVSHSDALGQAVSETWDAVENKLLRTVRRSKTGSTPLEEFRKRRAAEQESYSQARARARDFQELAAAQRKQADQLERGLLTPDLQGVLGLAQSSRLQAMLDARAATFRAEAERSERRHKQQLQDEANRALERQRKEQARDVAAAEQRAAAAVKIRRKELETQYSDTYRTGRGPFFAEMARAEAQRMAALQQALSANPLIHPRQRGHIQDAIANAAANRGKFLKMANSPDSTEPTGEYARLLGGFKGFTPMGFAANITKVAGWAAAVTVLYKSVELALHTLARFVEIGQQTARLEAVFKGVGGSARDLTGDMMKLASANARSTDEAMESATEWARLGLNRQQVNEAVRVSMVAANVANLHTRETTRQLSSLMHIYNLEVRDLNGVLGMLVGTSLRYNVTLEDLFTGLDRSAGMAKQSGMSLAELQGVIGGMVGKTGQSGIIIGNTVKSILSQFSNPTIQKYLRGFGIETLDRNLQEKPGSEMLRELFVWYQGADGRSRKDLTRTVAGRLQGSRFVAMMDSYVEGQKLAIDSQLDLNRAQEANVRILGSVKAMVSSLKVEWDKLAVSAGNTFGPAIADTMRTLRNTMRSWGLGASPRPPAPPSKKEQALFEWLDKETRRTGRTPGYWRSAIFSPVANDYGADGLGAAWLKYTQETRFERGEEEFRNRLQLHESAARGYAMRSRLFQTIGEALPRAREPEAASSMAKAAASEMDAVTAEAFKGAMQAGDVKGAQNLLAEAGRKSQKQSLEESSRAMETRTQGIAAATAERDDLGRQIEELRKKGGAEAEINQKLGQQALLQKEIDELNERNAESAADLNEELSQTKEIIELKQQYINLLKQQEMVLGHLQALSEQDTMGTMESRMQAQAGALRDQIALMEENEKRLMREGLEDTNTLRQVQKDLSERRAQLSALESPQMREAAATYDARSLAARRAREQAESYAVGYTEADKLLHQERETSQQLNTLREKSATTGLTENEAVRAKEMELQLWNTQEKIQSRILELARQEKQIRLDANREFQKGLLLAGPGEMLQRLHVAQLMQRKGTPGGGPPVSPGEFFAMSPEVRRMYFEATGGEAGYLNRWERRRLAGRSLSVEQQQAAQGEVESRVGYWNELLRQMFAGRMQQLPPLPLPQEQQPPKPEVGTVGQSSVPNLETPRQVHDQGVQGPLSAPPTTSRAAQPKPPPHRSASADAHPQAPHPEVPPPAPPGDHGIPGFRKVSPIPGRNPDVWASNYTHWASQDVQRPDPLGRRASRVAHGEPVRPAWHPTVRPPRTGPHPRLHAPVIPHAPASTGPVIPAFPASHGPTGSEFSPLVNRAKTAAESLGALAQAAALSARMLAQVNTALAHFQQTLAGHGQSRPTGPTLNLSAGHSLGAAIQ